MIGPGKPGLNSVAEYQASGLPWVTSSTATATPVKIDFPYVTNQITFKALGGTVRFGWTQNGVNGSNYFTLFASQSLVADIRANTLFVRSESGTVGFEVFAGLTTIPNISMTTLTASAVHNSASNAREFSYGLPSEPGVGTGLG